MILNLFEIPIFIGEIDLKKIKLKNRKLEKTWLSDTNSSYKKTLDENIESVIEKDSLIYLLASLIGKQINKLS